MVTALFVELNGGKNENLHFCLALFKIIFAYISDVLQYCIHTAEIKKLSCRGGGGKMVEE